MNLRKEFEQHIRGWLPDNRNASNVKRMAAHGGLRPKLRLVAFVGVALVLLIALFFFILIVLWTLNPIVPADVRIRDTLNDNKETLLSTEGVVGAGIARNSTNHITGIAVYVEDSLTSFDGIPEELGGFTVFVKRVSEASQLEKDNMIIRAPT